MLTFYYNHFPDELERETQDAWRAGAVPVECPSSEFDKLATQGERMIYVFTRGKILASLRRVRGEHITHAVLALGRPVEAAGEFELMVAEHVSVVTALNNLSGHYRPHANSLDVAVEAFEERGLRVSADGVKPYDLGTS